jgi:hypothetical protein
MQGEIDRFAACSFAGLRFDKAGGKEKLTMCLIPNSALFNTSFSQKRHIMLSYSNTPIFQ